MTTIRFMLLLSPISRVVHAVLTTVLIQILIGTLILSSTSTNNNRVNGNVCFILYSLADNNLEYYLRQDLLEFIVSPAIQNTTVTSWVYFDARNRYSSGNSINSNRTDDDDDDDDDYGLYINDITDPLLEVYNSDGSIVTEKYDGSHYLTYNHTQSKMIIDTLVDTEQNSDNPITVLHFLTHAISDCVRKGSNEYFLIFSSHGGGFAGYGGDDNIARRRQRKLQHQHQHQRSNRYLSNNVQHRTLLPQPNQFIVAAINETLQTVIGAPDKIDVLGFDACLMGDFGALDEYRDIAKYILASEATQPVHGWAYNKLDTAESAFDMAKVLQQSYLDEKQSSVLGPYAVHQTPKTLAIVDTTMYTQFLYTWEQLAIELNNLLLANDDPNYVTILTRTRGNTLSFEGGVGDSGTTTPSMMDIGQFFVVFEQFCNSTPSSTLRSVLRTAEEAYNAMFVARGVGEGTANATGMVIHWPTQQAYNDDPNLYELLIFNTSSIYATVDAPQWLTFLRTYYETITPTIPKTLSVCQNSVISSIEPMNENDLLLNPTITFDTETETAVFTSEVSYLTDSIVVSYGVNLTDRTGGDSSDGNGNSSSSDSSTRRLHDKIDRYWNSIDVTQYHGSVANEINSYHCHPHLHHEKQRRHQQQAQHQKQHHRKEQGIDLYLLYGGNSIVSFNGSVATATWNRNFTFIVVGTNLEMVYVIEKENGQKSFPVCYFPPESFIESTDLLGIVDDVTAILLLGCQIGELIYQTNQGLALSLYVNNPIYGTVSEVSAFAGGQISPISQVTLASGGLLVSTIVGGYFESIIDWNYTTEILIIEVQDKDTLTILNVDDFVMEAVSYDSESFSVDDNTGYPISGFDSYSYEYNIQQLLNTTTTTTTTSSFVPKTAPPSSPSSLSLIPTPSQLTPQSAMVPTPVLEQPNSPEIGTNVPAPATNNNNNSAPTTDDRDVEPTGNNNVSSGSIPIVITTSTAISTPWCSLYTFYLGIGLLLGLLPWEYM